MAIKKAAATTPPEEDQQPSEEMVVEQVDPDAPLEQQPVTTEDVPLVPPGEEVEQRQMVTQAGAPGDMEGGKFEGDPNTYPDPENPPRAY